MERIKGQGRLFGKLQIFIWILVLPRPRPQWKLSQTRQGPGHGTWSDCNPAPAPVSYKNWTRPQPRTRFFEQYDPGPAPASVVYSSLVGSYKWCPMCVGSSWPVWFLKVPFSNSLNSKKQKSKHNVNILYQFIVWDVIIITFNNIESVKLKVKTDFCNVFIFSYALLITV